MLGTGASYEHGLWIASALAISSVITDVFRKRALEPNDLYHTSFLLRLVTSLVFGVALIYSLAHHGFTPIRHAVPGLSFSGRRLPAVAEFIVYLLLDTSMVAAAQLLYLRSLQVADLSYFLPFVSLTPVLLIPTGFFLIGELPLPHQIAGVLLIVAGSLAMNDDQLARGWRSFFAAPFEKKASRNAVIIALLFALSNPVDKILIEMADPIFYAFAYSIALAVFFGFLVFAKGRSQHQPQRGTVRWIALGGSLDAIALLLQFTAYRYLNVILVIAIKRAGVILSVLAGWIVFREKKIGERLFATAIMAGGILLIYLPASPLQDALVTLIGLLAFSVKVAWRRRNLHRAQDVA